MIRNLFSLSFAFGIVTAVQAQQTQTDVVTPPADRVTAQAGTSVETVTAKPKWGVAYIGSTRSLNLDFDNNTTVLVNLLHFTYNHTENVSSTIRLETDHVLSQTVGGVQQKKDKFEFGQHLYQIADKNIYTLPGDVKISGYFRTYFPTSKSAINQTQIIRVRPRLDVAKNFGPLKLGVTNYYDIMARQKFIANDVETIDGQTYLNTTLKLPLGITPYTLSGFSARLFQNGDGHLKYYQEAGLGVDFLDRFNITGYVFSEEYPENVVANLFEKSNTQFWVDFEANF